MPSSFLKRHRTICNVLEEIRERHMNDLRTHELVDEAKDYAQRMSAKLVYYKNDKKTSDHIIERMLQEKKQRGVEEGLAPITLPKGWDKGD